MARAVRYPVIRQARAKVILEKVRLRLTSRIFARSMLMLFWVTFFLVEPRWGGP